MRKSIGISAITLVIVGLMITSASSIAVNNDSDMGVKITKLEQTATTMEIDMTDSMEMEYLCRTLDGTPVIEDMGDQLQPSIGKVGPVQLLAYRDDDLEQVLYWFSADNGESYDGGIYYDIMGEYPSISHWKDSAFIGTMVTDYQDCAGGATYHLEVADATDTETYDLTYWDWSSYGWSDMIDASSAATTRDGEDWFWGINSYVMSTTYTDPAMINGPFINYQTSADGQGTISWYELDGCGHTDATVDQVTKLSYAVYDALNTTSGEWYLFVRCDNTLDFDDEEDPVGGYSIEAPGSNIEYPVVAANDDKMVIACEVDGNIACLISSAGAGGLGDPITIAAGEKPDVEHMGGDDYVITYVSGGDLYAVFSDDAGQTWGTPELKASDVDESHKCQSLCTGGEFAFYQGEGTSDIDLFRADIMYVPSPIIGIKDIAGGLGKVTAVVANTGDADAENVAWTLNVEGSMVFGGTENAGTIATLGVGQEESIATGFLLGIGAISIDITADIAHETLDGSIILFFVNL